MKFNKVYIEITNICGLTCDFCPTKILQNQTISLNKFEDILIQVKNYTNVITFHVFGDPLVLQNLDKYLDLALKYKLKVEIVTTGYYLNKMDTNTLLHDSIKQINFSINSFNKNDMKMTLDEYLKPMFILCAEKLNQNKNIFINFRLWNIDNKQSEEEFNKEVFIKLQDEFKINIKNYKTTSSIRLAKKILIDFDTYFIWPSLNSTNNTNGTCYGLKSHFAILASLKVVPCCLDSYGCIDLGSLKTESLDSILSNEKTTNIINGFKNNIAVEDLCKKCEFKHRFN